MKSRQNTDLIIIYSSLFAKYKEIRCGMSTKRGGVSPEPYNLNMSNHVGDEPSNVKINRKMFFDKMNISSENIAYSQQVHSDKIALVSKVNVYSSCDALITNLPNIFLAITIADCVPIFLYDPISKAIGAVHTGWKGSTLGILEKTLRRMNEEFGMLNYNLIAYVGPSASVCCYEVGKEVAKMFDNKYLKHIGNGSAYLDMKLHQKDVLLSSGVLDYNIEISKYCTICNTDLFHSYRRDGNRSGRMMGIIGMTGSR
ncbi:MAG: peptidoglycan editing factor PgeF [Bacteroidota bacterium]|nr:peptidoglycan editing factor PgeF [Bacteroidota bacterium]